MRQMEDIIKKAIIRFRKFKKDEYGEEMPINIGAIEADIILVGNGVDILITDKTIAERIQKARAP